MDILIKLCNLQLRAARRERLRQDDRPLRGGRAPRGQRRSRQRARRRPRRPQDRRARIQSRLHASGISPLLKFSIAKESISSLTTLTSAALRGQGKKAIRQFLRELRGTHIFTCVRSKRKYSNARFHLLLSVLCRSFALLLFSQAMELHQLIRCAHV